MPYPRRFPDRLFDHLARVLKRAYHARGLKEVLVAASMVLGLDAAVRASDVCLGDLTAADLDAGVLVLAPTEAHGPMHLKLGALSRAYLAAWFDQGVLTGAQGRAGTRGLAGAAYRPRPYIIQGWSVEAGVRPWLRLQSARQAHLLVAAYMRASAGPTRRRSGEQPLSRLVTEPAGMRLLVYVMARCAGAPVQFEEKVLQGLLPEG